MFWLGVAIGPLIAVVLAFRLRPALLAILGVAATAGWVVAVMTAERLYPDCVPDCPPGQDRLAWISGIMFLLAVSLFLLAPVKHAWGRRGGSELPTGSP